MSRRLRADVDVIRDGFHLRADVDVAAGGCLAVLGPNGAGKSTLLAAIAGLVRLREGVVTLGERTLERPGQVRLRPDQRRITLLDQKPRLFPHLTAAQNIAFGPRSRGRDRGSARRIALDWLERVELPDRADARPHELSGGQQQRVALARALAAEPEALLLDEPFAALDTESAVAIRSLLAVELARTATTSVLVTHDVADAWQWA
ncbi:MAG TPA: ATP-binding cassette domain-containing protein, partial [Aeromicrobium sp.]|nr:ATP-binding cassette domain-containing protein [Aeromicrobium sp.]